MPLGSCRVSYPHYPYHWKVPIVVLWAVAVQQFVSLTRPDHFLSGRGRGTQVPPSFYSFQIRRKSCEANAPVGGRDVSQSAWQELGPSAPPVRSEENTARPLGALAY